MATPPLLIQRDAAAAVARGPAASRDPRQPGVARRSPTKYAQVAMTSVPACGAGSALAMGIIHAHRSLWHVLRELSESGDEPTPAWINDASSRARSPRTNFYEDEEALPEVAPVMVLCEELPDRLDELFWPDRPDYETLRDAEAHQ